MLFLQRKYHDAVAEYERTLSVDPEDLEAHYNLMLCYRGMGNDALASREERLYLRFKADEASRAITGPYKLTHPEDNNEAQAIHEHGSAVLRSSPTPGKYTRTGVSPVRTRLVDRSYGGAVVPPISKAGSNLSSIPEAP